MNVDVKLKRNVYIIIAAIVLMAVAVQVSRSEFIMEFSQNHDLAKDRQSLIALSKQQLPADAGEPKYCVVYDGNDEYGVKIKDNAVKMLQYMKKNTVSVNSAEAPVPFQNCRMIVFANQELDPIRNIAEVSDYVQNGGYVMFASSLQQDDMFYRLYRKFGIVSVGNQFQSNGIELKSNVLIGESGLQMNEPFINNTSSSVELDRDAELLAVSSEGTPLMWKRDYGKGSFMFFNGTILQEKINRGLLAGGISMLEPDFVYPVFNTKQLFIDDFPAPIRSGTTPLIYDAYKKDIPRFYHDVWWPDMLKAAKKSDFKYTAVLIQSYLDHVEPPFRYPVDEDRYNLISYGREVIKSGGEIGIHGYNHQALTMDPAVAGAYEYKTWKSEEDMAASIKEANRFLQEAFPSYQTYTYVPPSNVLSKEGRKLLPEAWPGLATIASLYEEDAQNLSYVQEYEIAADGIVEMPRVTSGYVEAPFERWAEANTVSSLGVFSHFVHPDDVIDSERGKGLTWEKLYDQFSSKLERVGKTYPWLRPMTATEGANSLVNTLTSQVSWTTEADRMTGRITNFREDMYFILRTERHIGQLKHCKVRKIDQNTYLVTAEKEKFEIGLGG
ncbi:MAG TPA: DUF2194 domain-containing protein [Paenibacillus cookii]|nr:DUF2194 domain-containing protein [Paenibacillus cookii]